MALRWGRVSDVQFPIGQRVRMDGHFAEPVTLEAVRPLGSGYECRVRLADGSPDETILSNEEAEQLLGVGSIAAPTKQPADPEKIRLLVESARIRLAYTHDRHFAVSLSGIRTLPHQIEAVYLRMLPQPRLQFLLADDPGAGKTIMAGLLIKEMRLREAIDRVLILCPAPLTIQWQDELLRWFGEPFDMIFSAVDQQQLVNPWRRANQVIASLDYAKQADVRERVWNERWDLVIIDEAHKCSAYTKSSVGRSDETEKTKRYQLAERLSANADNLLLLTATPHHGDDDRFAHFVRLIDPDIFPEPHRVGDQAKQIRRDALRLGPECPWALRRLKEDLRDLRGRRLFPDRHAHTVTFRLNREEYDLYKTVTAYINEFMPQGVGRRQGSAALARTVFQRRLASSTMAIYKSIRRRLERQKIFWRNSKRCQRRSGLGDWHNCKVVSMMASRKRTTLMMPIEIGWQTSSRPRSSWINCGPRLPRFKISSLRHDGCVTTGTIRSSRPYDSALSVPNFESSATGAVSSSCLPSTAIH